MGGMVKRVWAKVAWHSQTCCQNLELLNRSATTISAPTIKAGSTPRRLAIPWNNGKGVNRMSSRFNPTARRKTHVEAKKWPLGMTTPFDGPVVPEVYMMH